MSKRKDIEYIHKVTGLSYGESRRLYKENGEDLLLALGIEDALKRISESIPAIFEGLTKSINSFCEVIRSIDWSKAIENLSNQSNQSANTQILHDSEWIECNPLVENKYMLDGNEYYKCSKCYCCVRKKHSFCPNCKADMR